MEEVYNFPPMEGLTRIMETDFVDHQQQSFANDSLYTLFEMQTPQHFPLQTYHRAQFRLEQSSWVDSSNSSFYINLQTPSWITDQQPGSFTVGQETIKSTFNGVMQRENNPFNYNETNITGTYGLEINDSLMNQNEAFSDVTGDETLEEIQEEINKILKDFEETSGLTLIPSGQYDHEDVVRKLKTHVLQKLNGITLDDQVEEFNLIDHIINPKQDIPVTPIPTTAMGSEETNMEVQKETISTKELLRTTRRSIKRKPEPQPPGDDTNNTNEQKDPVKDSKRRSREASDKSRKKKKAWEESIKEECKTLQGKNNKLKQQVENLQEAIAKIMYFMKISINSINIQ